MDALGKRRVVISLIGIVAVGAVGVSLLKVLGKRPPPPAQAATVARPIAVRTVTLKKQAYRERLTGYGRARALRKTSVPAEVAGVVIEVSPRLEAGVTVQEGEELVKLDAHDLEQALAQAQAREKNVAAERKRLAAELETVDKRLRWASKELEASRAELKRVTDLLQTKSVTQSDVDRQSIQTSLREATYLQLEGQRKSVEAQMDRNDANRLDAEASTRKAEKDLARAVIRAPYTGRVVMRTVQRGARVAPGTALFDLVDMDRVEVAVALPASRYGLVAKGARAEVRLGAENPRAFECAVVRIAPVVDGEQRTFFVYLELDGNDVPPGAFVVAQIDGPLFQDVFVLPRTAFVGDKVFVADNGRARVRTPAARVLLPHVMLASDGVAEGERLIVTNLEEVADGTRVSAVQS